MKNKIKELRKTKGLRQEDLAAALGVSRQTIIAIENSKYNPTLELAMKLARYLDTTVEELFQLEVKIKKKLYAPWRHTPLHWESIFIFCRFS